MWVRPCPLSLCRLSSAVPVVEDVVSPGALVGGAAPSVVSGLFSYLGYPSSSKVLLNSALFSVLAYFFLILATVAGTIAGVVGVVVGSVIWLFPPFVCWFGFFGEVV